MPCYKIIRFSQKLNLIVDLLFQKYKCLNKSVAVSAVSHIINILLTYMK